jgi:mannose-6-phosphate isomerase-like protein (cupin superfamily)/DNA-binding XRE family transcriptional regulator
MPTQTVRKRKQPSLTAEPAVPARPSPAAERTRPCVGPQVRRLRRERELTLAQIAERTGLNVGYLSQIENDKASPSLETLAALATAMDVPITWFLLDQAPAPQVVRAAERRSWCGPGGVNVAEVDGGFSRDVRIVVASSNPGQRTGLHAHSGDEHHIVLSGRVRLTQGEHTVELGPGDYLLWDATIPHDSETLGPDPLELLIITHRTHGAETARPMD